mmetsp:Transcript_11817/g.17357  ORF Transcript_11817/g.17357 Transcript_11817/m.17357 type:complete len:247 (+) Transcript_11817:3058-3798(+)
MICEISMDSSSNSIANRRRRLVEDSVPSSRPTTSTTKFAYAMSMSSLSLVPGVRSAAVSPSMFDMSQATRIVTVPLKFLVGEAVGGTDVGAPVGAAVTDGKLVGVVPSLGVGDAVGEEVGDAVAAVGPTVGLPGPAVGTAVPAVGALVGALVGLEAEVGARVEPASVGGAVLVVGVVVGPDEGCKVGTPTVVGTGEAVGISTSSTISSVVRQTSLRNSRCAGSGSGVPSREPVTFIPMGGVNANSR